MSLINRFNPQTLLVLLFVLATAAIRVVLNFNYEISDFANYSPVGAMALFGGAWFNRSWKALLFSVGTLFLSDFILHQTVFKPYGNGFLYSGWWWVYGAFVLMIGTGRWLLQKQTAGRYALAVVATVLIHWIVTDIGVWMGSTLYAQDLGGYMACLVAAIPFEWRFLAGTLVYGTILFGGFALLRQRYAFLRAVD